MSEQFDRFDLAGRLERLGDRLMTACEKNEAIENRVDVLGGICRIALKLKALRMEAGRSADPDAAVAGSAARKYAASFAESRRVTGSATEVAIDPIIDDPADE